MPYQLLNIFNTTLDCNQEIYEGTLGSGKVRQRMTFRGRRVQGEI